VVTASAGDELTAAMLPLLCLDKAWSMHRCSPGRSVTAVWQAALCFPSCGWWGAPTLLSPTQVATVTIALQGSPEQSGCPGDAGPPASQLVS
jgi:hypothetical protein